MSEHKNRYSQAMARLEEILGNIDDSAVGIDELAEQVREATSLIQTCREILVRTEVGVQEALRSLDSENIPSNSPDRSV